MGRPAKTSRAAAVLAAIELIDAEGLEALSVSAVARRLGVSQPALYHHFADRADLVGAIADHLLASGRLPDLDSDPGPDWAQLLEDQAVALRRVVAAHPHAAPLLVEGSTRFAVPAIYEQWLSVLAGRGIPVHQRLLIIEGLEAITAGSAQALASRERLRLGRYPPPDSRHPQLSEVADMAASEGFDDESVFRQIVRSFLDGATSLTT